VENVRAIDPLGIADGFSPAIDYEANERDKKLAAAVMEKFWEAHEHRLPYERQWEIHRHYLKGDQLLHRDRETGDIVQLTRRDARRLYSINNQCRPTARSLVGKLMRSLARFEAIPATSDADEMHGARVADHLLSFTRRRERFDIKYLAMMESVAWAGTGCMSISWNKQRRKIAVCTEIYPNPEDPQGEPIECDYVGSEAEIGGPCVQCAMNMQEEAGAALQAGEEPPEPPILSEAFEGEIELDYIDIRDIFPEPGVEDPAELRWIIRRHAMAVTEVRHMFPNMAPHIFSDGNLESDSHSRLANDDLDSDGSFEYLNEHVYLYEYHEKPSMVYPDGRIVWVCNDIVVEEEGNLYWALLDRMPFYFSWWIRNPGEFWGESFLVQAWHRQKELNSLESVFREHAELSVRQKILNPLGSQVPSDEITATTNQVISHNPAAGEIRFMNPPPLAGEIFARRDQLMQDIRLQAAVSDAEAAIMGSDPNGRAMAIIEAESDQQIGPITMRNLDEMKQLHKAILLICQQFYHPDRKFTVAGEDGAAETYIFGDMVLKDGADLEIEADDGLPKNRAMRLNEVMNMYTNQLIIDPSTGMPDPFKANRMAKVKVPGVGPDVLSTEYAAAQEMVKKIEAQEPVQPQVEDDPMIFSQVLLAWLRGRGRKSEPMIQMAVRQAYMYYVSWAAMGRPPDAPGNADNADPENNGGSGPGGQDQSARGGTPNNPGNMGTNRPIGDQANRTIGMADQAGEAAARGNRPHES